MLLEDFQSAGEFDPRQVKIFVDLDGVMANFEKGMDKAMRVVFGPEHSYNEAEYERSAPYRTKMWKALRSYQEEHGGKIWAELEPMKDAHILWDFVRNYPTEILTATGDPTYGAKEQKHEWVPRHIDPSVKINLTRKAREKAAYAKQHHILIDDKEKAIKPWEAAGGIGILHTSAVDTIAKLKQLGL